MMKKLGLEVETQLPDETSFDEFQTAFTLPLSSSTLEAMNALLFWPATERRASENDASA
jgi:hypothetical protein